VPLWLKKNEQLLGELTEVQNPFSMFSGITAESAKPGRSLAVSIMLLFFLFQPMVSKSLMV